MAPLVTENIALRTALLRGLAPLKVPLEETESTLAVTVSARSLSTTVRVPEAISAEFVSSTLWEALSVPTIEM